MASAITIKYLNPKEVDVFIGKSWDRWSRFRIKRIQGKVYLDLIKGSVLTQEDFKTTCEMIKEGKDANYESN